MTRSGYCHRFPGCELVFSGGSKNADVVAIVAIRLFANTRPEIVAGCHEGRSGTMRPDEFSSDIFARVPSTCGRQFSHSEDSVAFVGGVAVKARVKRTRQLQLMGGYEGIFISGVALAPEQAASVRGGTYQVQNDSHVIVHGANFGLERNIEKRGLRRLELEQFTQTSGRAGLVGAGDLLSKTVLRGHKSARFAVTLGDAALSL